MADDELRAALRHFGLIAVSIERLTDGAVNEHWRVRVGGRQYVLRRYTRRHDPAGTPYEHAVLAYLADGGWPVAAPLLGADGRTVVECDGRRYALFPFLSGRPAAPRDRRLLRRKGALLARLHRTLARWPAPGQRAGFARVTEIDAYLAPDGFATLADLLRRVAGEDGTLAAAISRERAENLDELHALGHERLPDTPVHFEFYGANLLFDRDTPTAVLDWDFVHLDARLADIGRSVALDCGSGDGGIDPPSLACFLGGYVEESRLDEVEIRLLLPFVRANLVWLAALPLSLRAGGDPAPYLLPSGRHTAQVRLPRLRAQRAALEDTIREVMGSGNDRQGSADREADEGDDRRTKPIAPSGRQRPPSSPPRC